MMNPYERTASEMARQSEGPKRAAKKALAVGSLVGASSFAPILARAAPLLSEYIPQDLAVKGLSKINPKFGSFIKSAIGGGYGFDEIKSFIGDQIKESQNEQPVKDNRNIIEQYSPELFNFIKDQISQGRTPVEAGALAQLPKSQFLPTIKKIEQDHKTPWSSILQSVFGVESKAALQETQVEPQQKPQGIGAGQQALMQMIQQINQKLGS